MSEVQVCINSLDRGEEVVYILSNGKLHRLLDLNSFLFSSVTHAFHLCRIFGRRDTPPFDVCELCALNRNLLEARLLFFCPVGRHRL
jgi:hypothetical protein